jgi:large subunit ribosomal protein L33
MAERARIVLVCGDCGARNYKTSKASEQQERLSIKKFCSACKKHTVHKESK